MRVAIHNLGSIITGDVREPLTSADAIVCEDGRITELGSASGGSFDVVIDAKGASAAPGLIDSHVHVAFGDFTPRQSAIGYLASYVHGGVTTALSASEVHVPGRPRDAAGLVALAVAAHKCFEGFRPGGMRVHGGSLILDPALSPTDLARAHDSGVWLTKAGFGAVDTPFDYVPLVAEAKRLGMTTTLHVGGASIPGSSPVTAEHLLAIDPDVAFHCNGGPIAMTDRDYDVVLTECRAALQLCTAGNVRTALHVASEICRRGELHRVVLGTDTPTGSGIMPLGLWYTITHLAALGGVDPTVAVAWSTGNTADVYGLDTGRLRVGLGADIVLIDSPLGAAHTSVLDSLRNGDVPAVAAVIAGGAVRFVGRSRNSPPPTRVPVVTTNEIRHDFLATG